MSETANPHLVHTELTELFEAEAGRVAAILAALDPDDWDRSVATCPGWTVRKAAKHIGGAHRWAHAIVTPGGPVPPRSIDLGLPADDAGPGPGRVGAVGGPERGGQCGRAVPHPAGQ